MISRYLYEKECAAALILLTHTEQRTLDAITHDGWFDPEEYISRVGKKVYITDNQKQIMKWCPEKGDDPDTAEAKNRYRQLMVKKMAKHNRYSI